jgi:hypothetical protein
LTVDIKADALKADALRGGIELQKKGYLCEYRYATRENTVPGLLKQRKGGA